MITAANLVDLATQYFGDAVLKQGLTGTGDPDATLLVIAEGVRTRVQVACAANVGWPLPGVWPDGSPDPANPGSALANGTLYADVWPADIMSHAIGLLLWRSQASIDSMSMDQRKVGESHEKYFNDVEHGKIGVGIGGDTDAGPKIPVSARDAQGNANIPGIPDRAPISLKFDGDPFWMGLR